MKEIVGIRFRKAGKIYYFAPNGIKFEQGESAIVETVRGIECGEVMLENRELDDNAISSPLKPIIRKADKNDLKVVEKNKIREQEAFKICVEKIEARGLKMNLVDVECTFDNNKLLFYFTAETRIDFRELVKDLAAVFRTRIELRQIGVRDEAKVLGGLGICGREFCCKAHMGDFNPVSIKMAKEQGLSLNPTKISGTCGRLMCCLKYEQDCYEELLSITPKIGALVETADGRGIVEDSNLLTGVVKVKLDKNPDAAAQPYNRADVKILKDGRIKVNREEIQALKGLED
jgi:cell fate regulator YaaT (PSP1 superfamily)